jgi:exopolyphosphatase/guanosine-5'-triphosphate,3'-diphosphate pyrophosphatase
MAEEARSRGADHILAIATSAVRDALNGEEFARRVRETTGVEMEIVSGDREAYLTYLGATLGLSLTEGAIVCDLGGGSAELIAVDRSSVCWAQSERLGSGRLTERFVEHDPPTAAEEERVADHVRSVLATLPPVQAELAVFTGGTARHVAMLAGLEGTIMYADVETLDWIVALLRAQPSAAIVSRYGVEPERAKVLPAGAIALRIVAGFYRVERVAITRHGIREGVIVDALQQRRSP